MQSPELHNKKRWILSNSIDVVILHSIQIIISADCGFEVYYSSKSAQSDACNKQFILFGRDLSEQQHLPK